MRFDAATGLDWMATRAYGKPPAHPWSGELTALPAQVATVQTEIAQAEIAQTAGAAFSAALVAALERSVTPHAP